MNHDAPTTEPEAPAPPPDPIPDPHAVYWTNAYLDCPLIKPNDGANALGVLADPVALNSIIGIAYPMLTSGASPPRPDPSTIPRRKSSGGWSSTGPGGMAESSRSPRD